MSAHGVELRHLRALVAVAQEGTFTDAAIALGITQPAVSRTVASLEAALGVALVQRSTRSVELTAAGQRCLAAAVDALAAVDRVAVAAAGVTPPLRLGYAWSALGGHTTEVLRRWRAEYPDVPLEVHRYDSTDAGLLSRRSDVAVVRGSVAVPGTQSRTVVREQRYAALPTGHRLASTPSVTLADLTDEVVLTTTYGTTTLELWPADIRPARSVHLDNTDEWLTEIAGGTGIGVTAEATTAMHPHPGVVYVPMSGVAPVDVHLVWPATCPHASVAAFVALVRDVVRRAGAVSRQTDDGAG